MEDAEVSIGIQAEAPNERNDMVKVMTPPYNEYVSKFMAAVAGGVPPDVVWTTTGRDWGRQGLLMPLEPLISKSKVIDWDDFFGAPKIYSEDPKTEHIYSVPLETDARPIVLVPTIFVVRFPGLDVTFGTECR